MRFADYVQGKRQMKIFIPRIPWHEGFNQALRKAFDLNGVEVVTNSNRYKLNKLIGALPLRKISPVQDWERRHCLKKYNEELLKQVRLAKPDVFLVFNESLLYPDTIHRIKTECRCKMVCCVGDDPWDSIRWVADFPHSLKHFEVIFSGEPAWDINIRKVAPQASIYWHYGGYDPDVFFPIEESAITDADTRQLSCQISFTGSSYGTRAEGAYRSDILAYLADYNLKIWGGDKWPYRFKYLPELRSCYQGERLSFEELRKLYRLCKINLNLPAPQVVTTFQPRVFEIAACKGFQIIDRRDKLFELFGDDCLVSFDTIGELREKIDYYLNHEQERLDMAQKLFLEVWEKHTWSKWAEGIIQALER